MSFARFARMNCRGAGLILGRHAQLIRSGLASEPSEHATAPVQRLPFPHECRHGPHVLSMSAIPRPYSTGAAQAGAEDKEAEEVQPGKGSSPQVDGFLRLATKHRRATFRPVSAGRFHPFPRAGRIDHRVRAVTCTRLARTMVYHSLSRQRCSYDEGRMTGK